MSGIINNQSNIGQAIEQEPVAFRLKLSTGTYLYQESYFGGAIPLYTHPMRELSDEKIESAYWSLVGKQHEGKIASYLYNFARDILQKASEK